jgi:molybdate transport system ATP-binding protein
MAHELICHCRKRLASGFEVDADLRLPLAAASVTVLYGPSGSGKTTLLRLLAGLDRPDEGEIQFGAETWHSSARAISLPPQARRAGFLFQNYALFPHLTVEENVAYAARAGAAARLMDAFGLSEFAARRPAQISGGQQQRVALARALAAAPALLLLDEPLSALDAATRSRTRQELRRLLLSSGVPSIVVTHDRTEAVALGDWMAVMVNGRIRQTGAPPGVFRRPADAEAAACLGVENVLPANVLGASNGLLTIEIGPVHLECVDNGERGAAWACIRAEDIALVRAPQAASSVRNRLPGKVESVTLEGALARVELDCGFPLVAAITAQSAAELALEPGAGISAAVKATAVHLTPAERRQDCAEQR